MQKESNDGIGVQGPSFLNLSSLILNLPYHHSLCFCLATENHLHCPDMLFGHFPYLYPF